MNKRATLATVVAGVVLMAGFSFLRGQPAAAAPSTPHPHVVHFTAATHSALLVVGQPTLSRGSKGVVITITSPRSLTPGPVRYEGGYEQKKLAATVFLYNTRSDFFQAGLALRAGGGPGCATHAGKDVCRTLVGSGFLHFHHHRWKRLKITLFKPAHQPATVGVVSRAG